MNILALDLGTKTGWALGLDGAVSSGTWVLASPKEIKEARKYRLDRTCDPRFLRLFRHVEAVVEQVALDWVVFEDVEFSKGRMQAHLWASWRAVVWMQGIHGQKTDCLSTGKLKQFATGSGAADKDQMAKSLTMNPRYELHPKGVKDLKTGDVLGDDAVDALHLLAWAQEMFRG